jgi:hypothetical protein
MWVFKMLDGGGVGMEWIDLTWDRDKWQALVNVIMNIWVP